MFKHSAFPFIKREMYIQNISVFILPNVQYSTFFRTHNYNLNLFKKRKKKITI